MCLIRLGGWFGNGTGGTNFLSLHDAARLKGVKFTDEALPRDGFIMSNGLRHHYVDWGDSDNPTVVLLHGFAQTCHSWDFTSLGLCDRFRVLALDLRGHGDSQWASDADYSYNAILEDLHCVVETLGIRTFALMGNSLGGRIALLHASECPELVKGLVIVDAAPEHLIVGSARVRRFAEQVDMLCSLEDFVDRVCTYNKRRSADQVRSSLIHNVKKLQNGKWTWKYDVKMRSSGFNYWQEPGLPDRLWQAVEKIQCPTLVVRGGGSNVVSASVAKEMGRRMADCRVATVENAGHLVVGDNPAEFQSVVEPFFNDLF